MAPRGGRRGAPPIFGFSLARLPDMRAYTFSIAISGFENGSWSVAIVRKTLRGGVVVDEDLIYGPAYVYEDKLGQTVHLQMRRLQEYVRQDRESRVGR
jgi:hypothetical protein